MSIVTKAIARVGGFGASVIVTGAANIVTVPFVIVHTGGPGWASVAVGQSLGAIVGILTLLGWVQTGPTAIARSSGAARAHYFTESVFIRFFSLLVTVPVCAFSVLLLNTEYRAATFVSAVAMLALNLGATWFYIGEGNPHNLFLFDAVPRAAGIAVGTFAVTKGSGVFVYACLVLLGALLAAVISTADVWWRYGTGEFRLMGPRAIGATLVRQRHGIGTALLSSAYLSAPILVLQSMVPAAVPSFALADKIKQQALTAYRPFSQTLQGWTPKARDNAVRGRVMKTFRVVVILGIVGGLVFIAGFPWVSRVLGAGEVSAPLSLGIPMGIAFGMNIWSLTLGVACLLPLGLEKHVTASAAIGLGVTAVLIVPLTLSLSGVGTASAVAVGQTCVATYQVWILRKNLRSKAVGDVVRR